MSHFNWGRATGNGGTGAQTLSAVSGSPTIYQSVGVIGLPFSYSARDPSTKAPLEAGIGVLTDATTMTRTPRATWDGSGTPTRINPTAVSLPAGALIDLAPQAATVGAAPTTIDSANTTGRNLLPEQRTHPSSTIGLTALRLYWLPFKVGLGGVANSLAINVTTAATSGGLAQLGLYAFSPSGGIGPKLAETGQFAVDTTGFKQQSLNVSVPLSPGWYIVAVAASLGVTLTAHNNSASQVFGVSPFGMSGASMTAIDYKHETLGALAMPASPGTLTSINVGGAFPAAALIGVA
jgi:hypothetical protein